MLSIVQFSKRRKTTRKLVSIRIGKPWKWFYDIHRTILDIHRTISYSKQFWRWLPCPMSHETSENMILWYPSYNFNVFQTATLNTELWRSRTSQKPKSWYPSYNFYFGFLTPFYFVFIFDSRMELVFQWHTNNFQDDGKDFDMPRFIFPWIFKFSRKVSQKSIFRSLQDDDDGVFVRFKKIIYILSKYIHYLSSFWLVFSVFSSFYANLATPMLSIVQFSKRRRTTRKLVSIKIGKPWKWFYDIHRTISDIHRTISDSKQFIHWLPCPMSHETSENMILWYPSYNFHDLKNVTLDVELRRSRTSQKPKSWYPSYNFYFGVFSTFYFVFNFDSRMELVFQWHTNNFQDVEKDFDVPRFISPWFSQTLQED
jgi:hypothetical protein